MQANWTVQSQYVGLMRFDVMQTLMKNDLLEKVQNSCKELNNNINFFSWLNYELLLLHLPATRYLVFTVRTPS